MLLKLWNTKIKIVSPRLTSHSASGARHAFSLNYFKILSGVKNEQVLKLCVFYYSY